MPSEFFGNEPDGWDVDGTGRVGISHFANAVQVWAIRNEEAGRPSHVAAAAEAFAADPRMIIEAVKSHYWMFLSGADDDFSKMLIEHEGE